MKKLKLLIPLICFLSISLTFWQCEPNDDSIYTPDPIQQSKKIINKISLKELPLDLMKSVDEMGRAAKRNTRNVGELLILNESQIIQVIDSLSNVRYSVKFSLQNQPENVLYNLILGTNAENQVTAPFILKYTINNPEEVYESLIPDYTKMKGKISKFDLETFLNYLETSDRTEDVEPAPCSEYENNDSSNGGDDSSSDGDDSSSGSTGGGGTTGGNDGNGDGNDYTNGNGNDHGDGSGDGSQGQEFENPDVTHCNVTIISNGTTGEVHTLSFSCDDGSGGSIDLDRTEDTSDCPGDGDVGINDDREIVDSPDDPIDDMAAFLDCFDSSGQTTVTIYADQPDPDNPDRDHWMGDVGHAFITIEQGGNRVSYGFYPESGWGLFGSTTGVMGNDQSHGYDVSISTTVSGAILTDLMNLSITFAESSYNLQSSNCTNFVVQAANLVGFDIPIDQCIGSYGVGQSGASPARLGQFMRDMDLPSGATRDDDGGDSPANNEC